MWPITAPVSISHWTLFPQELPSVELSAQVWTQLAQGANLLSIPDCVTLASGFLWGGGVLFSHLENGQKLDCPGQGSSSSFPNSELLFVLKNPNSLASSSSLGCPTRYPFI